MATNFYIIYVLRRFVIFILNGIDHKCKCVLIVQKNENSVVRYWICRLWFTRAQPAPLDHRACLLLARKRRIILWSVSAASCSDRLWRIAVSRPQQARREKAPVAAALSSHSIEYRYVVKPFVAQHYYTDATPIAVFGVKAAGHIHLKKNPLVILQQARKLVSKETVIVAPLTQFFTRKRE